MQFLFFSNLPAYSLQLLQTIQSYAARLIFQRTLSARTTPLLINLHWLPVAKRIDFKILLLTYKAVHFSQPPYLASLLVFKSNPRKLRHHDPLLLTTPNHRILQGQRSFSVYAPKLWNSVPFNIRNASSVATFKKLLKTHLFQLYLSSNYVQART